MKIAYLSSSAIPSTSANSIHVMKMCQAFAHQGHSVKLICTHGKEPVKDDYKFYGVEKCFDIVKLPYPSGRLGGLYYGIKTRNVFAGRVSFPDIFHARNIYAMICVANLGIPFIYEAHVAPGKMRFFVEKWLFQHENFRKLVVISNALKVRYLELFSLEDHERVQVAHDAADLPQHDGCRFINAMERRIQVGYFGSLRAERGIWIITELVKRFPSINFHLFGGQPEDVSTLKSKLRNYKNVSIYGFMPYPEAEKFRQTMDVLIAPYQDTVVTSDWMSPLKIFEYMAAGKAIISSDFPVLREILTDEFNAIMVKPKDIEDWQRALERLSKDDELRKRLGANARDSIVREYTWSTRAAKIIAESHI